MDRNVLEKRGFSLIELSLVFVIGAILLGTVFYSARSIRQAALARKTIQELDVLVSASSQYYLGNGAYPTCVLDLRPVYLSPQATGVNPFGNAYCVTPGVLSVSVSTLLPKGLLTPQSFGSEVVVINQGNNDLVSVTKPLESGIWSLKYDKKNIYRQ